MRRRDGLIYTVSSICIISLIALQFKADGESALYGHYKQAFFGDLDAYCFHDYVQGGVYIFGQLKVTYGHSKLQFLIFK